MRLSREQSKSLARWVRERHPRIVAEGEVGADAVELESLLGCGVGPDDDCIEWGMGLSHGYGAVSVSTLEGQRVMGVHRAIREIVEGESELSVLHRCGNKPCFNPGHTYYGTHSDNAEDMFRLGEFSGFGESHYNAKLSTQDVAEIREVYFTTGLSQREIGDMYGVRQNTISRVISGARRSRG